MRVDRDSILRAAIAVQGESKKNRKPISLWKEVKPIKSPKRLKAEEDRKKRR